MQAVDYNVEYRDDCIQLFKSNFDKYFDPSELAEFVHFLDNDALNSFYRVVLIDGKVVACGGVSNCNDFSYLCWGMVRRDLHGKGLGSILTKTRLSLIKSENLPRLVKLDTSQHTEGFYSKCGFSTTEIVLNGFGEGIDKVSMELMVDEI